LGALQQLLPLELLLEVQLALLSLLQELELLV
jgi:hypothetical protein